MSEDVLSSYPAASGRAVTKEIDHLDRHCRAFIALSPLAVLSTSDAAGLPDLSPRGGPPGFVRVTDEHTLVLPDRPGNNRLDSLRALRDNPRVALLFLVPGINETLRVFGAVDLVDAGRTGLDLTDHGRAPRSALVLHVNHAFFHCAKALMRSQLWSADAQVDRSVFPTMAELMHDHAQSDDPPESDEAMTARYRSQL